MTHVDVVLQKNLSTLICRSNVCCVVMGGGSVNLLAEFKIKLACLQKGKMFLEKSLKNEKEH